jgi:hypothetical protein
MATSGKDKLEQQQHVVLLQRINEKYVLHPMQRWVILCCILIWYEAMANVLQIRPELDRVPIANLTMPFRDEDFGVS